VELLHKHRYGQFDRPIKFVPDLPLEIDEMVCQLLEKDPDKRPRDAQVFHRQVEGIAKKLDRQGDLTSVDNRDTATKAENRTDRGGARPVLKDTIPMNGAAHGRAGGADVGASLGHVFNRPVVLFLILLLCIGTLVYGFWPLSQDQLFERGAKLMESGKTYDMKRAWTEYLEPLERGYPDHPYQDKVAEFRKKWESAQSGQTSEAQRFFHQGELLAKQGHVAAAQQKWRGLIDVFAEVEAEKEWVQRARRALRDLDHAANSDNRFVNVKAALARAEELRRAKKLDEAERIWKGIEQLYGSDPTATDIIREVQKARNQ
jgi:serine/threonine-protein kinase